jgi:AsmA protein
VAGAGWSKDAIDVSALATMDASVAITADAVDLGLAKLGAVQVMLTVDRARAVFDIRRIVAYDGTVAGQFVVNGRKGLSVGGDLGFAGMALQPLLHVGQFGAGPGRVARVGHCRNVAHVGHRVCG